MTCSQRKARKEKNAMQLKAGSPLPAKGTCKHYKRSYRWLRFPCCGKAYPCELCHAMEADHEGKVSDSPLLCVSTFVVALIYHFGRFACCAVGPTHAVWHVQPRASGVWHVHSLRF
jgi:hypothetical protein